MKAVIAAFVCLICCTTAIGQVHIPGSHSGFVTTSPAVKIHYIQAGEQRPPQMTIRAGTPPTFPVPGKPKLFSAPAILFIPGWTMPAWIWEKQIEYFAREHRVIAMDPRSQGESTMTSEGLDPATRARDIKTIVDKLHLAPVVLVGWSMATTEIAAFIDQFGTKDIAAIVLVDDDGGDVDPKQDSEMLSFIANINRDREKVVSRFIRDVFFKRPQSEEYLNRVIQASLRTPTSDAVALLVGKTGADYRRIFPKIDCPTLVLVARSDFMQSILEMQKHIPGSQLEIFEGVGHALFVDDPDRFNATLNSFLLRLLY
jgi:microsomal epoxide hydrolase